MKDTYIYPAVFYDDDDGISIVFPDLPGCCPCADNIDEAVKNAREALGVHLHGMELDGDEIPKASDPREIDTDGGILMLVDVFMPTVRDRIKNRYIKKTLTIPYWLNAEAESRNVNFSALLQDALKQYLHVGR